MVVVRRSTTGKPARGPSPVNAPPEYLTERSPGISCTCHGCHGLFTLNHAARILQTCDAVCGVFFETSPCGGLFFLIYSYLFPGAPPKMQGEGMPAEPLNAFTDENRALFTSGVAGKKRGGVRSIKGASGDSALHGNFPVPPQATPVKEMS